MVEHSKIIYLHGLESTSQSGKARIFAQKYPGMLTPDFSGSFHERMEQLNPILGGGSGWRIIGSSFGGAMGAKFTCEHPDQVNRLILLAPALILPEFAMMNYPAIETPTVLIHGAQDEIVPAAPVKEISERVFKNLKYILVQDGHRLHKTMADLNWDEIVLSLPMDK
jgi:pimeloyl-ACP methyl ester carboxylesterase